MSKARTPGMVFEDLQAIRMALPSLLVEYRRAYDFAFSPGGGAGGESGRAGDIAHSDPTGDVAIAKSAARGKVRRAGESIADALSELNAASSDLEKAYPKDPDTYQEVQRLPPRMTKDAAVAEAEEFQLKRERNGEMGDRPQARPGDLG